MITGPDNIKNGLILCFDSGNVKSFSEDKSLINVSTWTIGSGSTSGYNRNGSASESERKNGIDPWGNSIIIWEAIPDSVSGADGGWNTTTFNIDNTKMYRFSVWVNRTVQGNGNFYFGTRGYGTVNGVLGKDNGINYTNPYFWVSSAPTVVGEWTLIVGHIWEEGSANGSTHEDSGRYTISGGKIGSISRDFIWLPETETSVHRSYLFYSTDTSTRQQWCYPRVDICDGTEPSIEDLLNNKPNKVDDIFKNNSAYLLNGILYDTDKKGILKYDGIKNTIKLESPIIKSGGGWSLCFWIKYNTIATSFNGETSPANFIGGSTIYNSNYFSVYSGKLALYSKESSGWRFGSTNLNSSTWYHVSLVCGVNGESYKIYLNGVEEGGTHTTQIWDSAYSGLSINFIGSLSGTGRRIDGDISQVYIYDISLSNEEVLQNYNSTKSRYINI